MFPTNKVIYQDFYWVLQYYSNENHQNRTKKVKTFLHNNDNNNFLFQRLY